MFSRSSDFSFAFGAITTKVRYREREGPGGSDRGPSGVTNGAGREMLQ